MIARAEHLVHLMATDMQPHGPGRAGEILMTELTSATSWFDTGA